MPTQCELISMNPMELCLLTLIKIFNERSFLSAPNQVHRCLCHLLIPAQTGSNADSLKQLVNYLRNELISFAVNMDWNGIEEEWLNNLQLLCTSMDAVAELVSYSANMLIPYKCSEEELAALMLASAEDSGVPRTVQERSLLGALIRRFQLWFQLTPFDRKLAFLESEFVQFLNSAISHMNNDDARESFLSALHERNVIRAEEGILRFANVPATGPSSDIHAENSDHQALFNSALNCLHFGQLERASSILKELVSISRYSAKPPTDEDQAANETRCVPFSTLAFSVLEMLKRNHCSLSVINVDLLFRHPDMPHETVDKLTELVNHFESDPSKPPQDIIKSIYSELVKMSMDHAPYSFKEWKYLRCFGMTVFARVLDAYGHASLSSGIRKSLLMFYHDEMSAENRFHIVASEILKHVQIGEFDVAREFVKMAQSSPVKGGNDLYLPWCNRISQCANMIDIYQSLASAETRKPHEYASMMFTFGQVPIEYSINLQVRLLIKQRSFVQARQLLKQTLDSELNSAKGTRPTFIIHLLRLLQEFYKVSI